MNAIYAPDVWGKTDEEKKDIVSVIMDGTDVYYDNALLRKAIISQKKFQQLKCSGRVVDENLPRHASSGMDRMVAASTERTTRASRCHDSQQVTGIAGIFPDAE
jgi:hypothetical protein